MRMKIQKIMLASAVALLCLAGCGNSDSEGKGQITIVTKDTTAATTPAPADSSADESVPDDASAADESSAAQPDAGPAVPADAPLSEKAKFIYKGVTIGVGEKFSDYKDKLGDMQAPMNRSQPCIPGAGESTNYAYDGMSISTNKDDVIYSISLDHDYTKSNEPSTAGGLHLEQTEEDTKRILGDIEPKFEGLYSYEDGDLELTVTIYDGKILTIHAENLQLLMEE